MILSRLETDHCINEVMGFVIERIKTNDRVISQCRAKAGKIRDRDGAITATADARASRNLRPTRPPIPENVSPGKR